MSKKRINSKTATKTKAVLEFEHSEFQSLPVGCHEPCELTEVTRHDPASDESGPYGPPKPYWCFKFTLRDPDKKLHEHEAVRMCSETTSKMGNLFAFCTDLEGGEEPAEFNPEKYVKHMYRIKVRKRKQSDKLQVESAEPLDPADDSPF